MAETGDLRDMLVFTLGNEGPYEGFVETREGLQAYVPATKYDPAWLDSTVQAFPIPLQYKAVEMEDRNWNEEWERQHEAILVRYNGGSVWVRAPFHPHRTDVDYELIIEPKMSFGTAHHPTTAMMLAYVAELDMVDKRVLDMGCGTAILAILAKMRGAYYVEGIDVDDWAYRNAQENAEANGVDITLRLGDASLLQGTFDIVIANINRNILLCDMEAYARVMAPGATLLLSGFYQADEEVLISKAQEFGMTFVDKKSVAGWSALRLVK